MLERKDEFLEVMTASARKISTHAMVLMLTDVLLEGSKLLFVGDEDAIRQAFQVKTTDNTAFLPKVMSRKKQVIPMLSALWG